MLEFKYIKNKYWQTFILAFLVALLFFLPISLRDALLGQPFHYAGDYNSQSMLFWQYAYHFINDGGSFSWETELGCGFVKSYSYYMLGSPFFWASRIIASKSMLCHHSSSTGRTNSFLNFYIYYIIFFIIYQEKK